MKSITHNDLIKIKYGQSQFVYGYVCVYSDLLKENAGMSESSDDEGFVERAWAVSVEKLSDIPVSANPKLLKDLEIVLIKGERFKVDRAVCVFNASCVTFRRLSDVKE